MKKLILLTFTILTVSFNQLAAQNLQDSIAVKESLGPVFLRHGHTLKPKQLLQITQINPEAYSEMKKAKTNFDLAMVVGTVGGFLVGYNLGTAIGGGQPNWAVAGVGVGLIGGSIPFTIGYNKRARNAVKIYNAGLVPLTYQE